jgi:HSP20 family molecular chaperone IbpA
MYDDFFRLFDEIFTESLVPARLRDRTQAPRINKMISSSPFPPTNIICNSKTKDLTIQVALAGYSEEDINLSFEGDYLKLVVDKPDTKTMTEDDVHLVIQQGIKLPSKIETTWAIDPRYYSRDNVAVSFKDGLLSIVVTPRDEIKPINVKLFGKLSDTPRIENKAD